MDEAEVEALVDRVAGLPPEAKIDFLLRLVTEVADERDRLRAQLVDLRDDLRKLSKRSTSHFEKREAEWAAERDRLRATMEDLRAVLLGDVPIEREQMERAFAGLGLGVRQLDVSPLMGGDEPIDRHEAYAMDAESHEVPVSAHPLFASGAPGEGLGVVDAGDREASGVPGGKPASSTSPTTRKDIARTVFFLRQLALIEDSGVHGDEILALADRVNELQRGVPGDD